MAKSHKTCMEQAQIIDTFGTYQWRGPTLGHAGHPPGCPVAPLGAPFRLFNPLVVETPKQELLSRYAAATGRKPTGEKPISSGEIPPGRSPPGRGDRRHHHHRHGHHRDHHKHHPQHQHHLHLHPISSHNCNLCCNPYYLPPSTLLVLITTLW